VRSCERYCRKFHHSQIFRIRHLQRFPRTPEFPSLSCARPTRRCLAASGDTRCHYSSEKLPGRYYSASSMNAISPMDSLSLVKGLQISKLRTDYGNPEVIPKCPQSRVSMSRSLMSSGFCFCLFLHSVFAFVVVRCWLIRVVASPPCFYSHFE
jgi:hypothetical protein